MVQGRKTIDPEALKNKRKSTRSKRSPIRLDFFNDKESRRTKINKVMERKTRRQMSVIVEESHNNNFTPNNNIINSHQHSGANLESSGQPASALISWQSTSGEYQKIGAPLSTDNNIVTLFTPPLSASGSFIKEDAEAKINQNEKTCNNMHSILDEKYNNEYLNQVDKVNDQSSENYFLVHQLRQIQFTELDVQNALLQLGTSAQFSQSITQSPPLHILKSLQIAIRKNRSRAEINGLMADLALSMYEQTSICDRVFNTMHRCCICQDLPYKEPVVSIVCWHVLCLTCWLSSLATKRYCPQCGVGANPGDLRRIYL